MAVSIRRERRTPQPPNEPERDADAMSGIRTFDGKGTWLVAAALLTLAAACGGEREKGDARTTPPAETAAPAHAAASEGSAGAPAPLAASEIVITPEDVAIAKRTLETAKAERLDTLPIGQIVTRIGRTFVGAPYVPGTLDPDGPEKLIVNLREFDCVTFVENSLALARTARAGSVDVNDYIEELRRIRYRDGVSVRYPERLHYFSEWIAANSEKGIVRDMTAALGGLRDTTRIDFMSTHPSAYRQLSDASFLSAVKATEEMLSGRGHAWIPQDAIAEAAPSIKDGDVIAATSTVKGLDIAHTGIAIHIDGALHLMHAPLVGKSVELSTLPLAERIRGISGQDGVMVARPL
jgi:hypothetical protein